MSEADLERDLERLRRASRDKLGAKLARLASLLGGSGGVPERAQLEAARDLAHMLKGTSGCYGLDELCAELQAIEERLDRLLDAGSEGAGATWKEIERALERARNECS